MVTKLRGRSKTTLPIVVNRDLSPIQHPIRLHSSKDLTEITILAQNRKCWRGLTSEIEKAAEVSQFNLELGHEVSKSCLLLSGEGI